jgi:hypothetical protein
MLMFKLNQFIFNDECLPNLPDPHLRGNKV